MYLLLVTTLFGVALGDYIKFSTDQRGFFIQERPTANENLLDYVY
jgi:hypothetical protein